MTPNAQPTRVESFDRSALAQLLEPPYTDPYVRWCGRGGAARLPPIPILSCYRTPANRTNAKQLPPCRLPGVKRTCSALVVTSDSDPPLKLATSTHPQSAAGSRSCRGQTQRCSSRSHEYPRIFRFRRCIE